jgi:hypothetical protein
LLVFYAVEELLSKSRLDTTGAETTYPAADERHPCPHLGLKLRQLIPLIAIVAPLCCSFR